MSKKPSAYNQAIHLLQELKHLYPTYSLGQHISTSLSDYGDAWGITDKELVFALEKYKTELEFNTVPDEDINKIIEEGKDLTKLFNEDEYEEG